MARGAGVLDVQRDERTVIAELGGPRLAITLLPTGGSERAVLVPRVTLSSTYTCAQADIAQR